MVLVNFNTDMGDGWEWIERRGVSDLYPVHRAVLRMFINEIVYTLTH